VNNFRFLQFLAIWCFLTWGYNDRRGHFPHKLKEKLHQTLEAPAKYLSLGLFLERESELFKSLRSENLSTSDMSVQLYNFDAGVLEFLTV
jgi:hypothetical protein